MSGRVFPGNELVVGCLAPPASCSIQNIKCCTSPRRSIFTWHRLAMFEMPVTTPGSSLSFATCRPTVHSFSDLNVAALRSTRTDYPRSKMLAADHMLFMPCPPNVITIIDNRTEKNAFVFYDQIRSRRIRPLHIIGDEAGNMRQSFCLLLAAGGFGGRGGITIFQSIASMLHECPLDVAGVTVWMLWKWVEPIKETPWLALSTSSLKIQHSPIDEARSLSGRPRPILANSPQRRPIADLPLRRRRSKFLGFSQRRAPAKCSAHGGLRSTGRREAEQFEDGEGAWRSAVEWSGPAALCEIEPLRDLFRVSFSGHEGKGNERHEPPPALLQRRMKRACTAHGFRSSFRDWCWDEAGIDRNSRKPLFGARCEGRNRAGLSPPDCCRASTCSHAHLVRTACRSPANFVDIHDPREGSPEVAA